MAVSAVGLWLDESVPTAVKVTWTIFTVIINARPSLKHLWMALNATGLAKEPCRYSVLGYPRLISYNPRSTKSDLVMSERSSIIDKQKSLIHFFTLNLCEYFNMHSPCKWKFYIHIFPSFVSELMMPSSVLGRLMWLSLAYKWLRPCQHASRLYST